MKKTALIVVDLQEDFLPPNGSLAIKMVDQLYPKSTNYYHHKIIIPNLIGP